MTFAAVKRERTSVGGREPLTQGSRASTARAVLACLAMGLIASSSLSLLHPAFGSTTPLTPLDMPRSYFELSVLWTDRNAPRVDFSIQLYDPLYYNYSGMTAKYVAVYATVGPELEVNGTAGGTWSATASFVQVYANFTMSATETPAVQQNLTANPNAPMFTSITVAVMYTDDSGYLPRTITRTITFGLNFRPSSSALLLSAAIGMGLGGAGVVGLGLFVLRRARLQELYLMHDSGMLIRHWSKVEGMVHDSDIMSGMLVVLQDFVRDSLRSSNNEDAELDELRFGPQRVVLARAKHTVLAAVVQGRYLNGLPRKLRQAVGAFESSNLEVLEDWNGNVDLFPGADDLAAQFLKGRSRTVA